MESTYEKCLAHELRANNIDCVAQMALPIEYKGLNLDCGYRVDLMLEGTLIVGLKSVDSLQRIPEAQLLTYMKLADIRTGLLKNGVKRLVL